MLEWFLVQFQSLSQYELIVDARNDTLLTKRVVADGIEPGRRFSPQTSGRMVGDTLLNYRYRQLKSRYLTTHPIAKAHHGTDTTGYHNG